MSHGPCDVMMKFFPRETAENYNSIYNGAVRAETYTDS